MATIWEAYDDGTFGLISKDYQLRPTAHSIRRMREVLPGTMINSWKTSTNPSSFQKIKVFATKNAYGGASIVLVNYSQTSDYNVNLSIKNLSANSYSLFEVSKDNLSGRYATLTAAGMQNIKLPPNSVFIIRSN